MRLSNFERRKSRDLYKIKSKNPDYIISVEKSNKHVSIFLSNSKGINITSVSSKSIKDCAKSIKNSAKVAEIFCDKLSNMIEANKKFAFNKSGYAFHGIVSTIAQKIKDRGISCT
jgi:ribosomal protein L18